MSKYIKINRGLDIKLAGEASKILSDLPLPETFAIKLSDFIGITPLMLVKPGDNVQSGTPLFVDKTNEAIQFCSPVSGEVTAVNDAVVANPALVNTDPYGEGWFFKLKLTKPEEAQSLLTPDAYTKQVTA